MMLGYRRPDFLHGLYFLALSTILLLVHFIIPVDPQFSMFLDLEDLDSVSGAFVSDSLVFFI